jgi:predicted phage tail protein
MDTHRQPTSSKALRAIHYDAARRRLWLFGQRCHHGATGAVLTAAGAALVAGRFVAPTGFAALAATGTILMAHDWKDRTMWFERGYGSQP